MADDPTARGGERAAATTAGCEPDYRFTLANERTFLAWQRTRWGCSPGQPFGPSPPPAGVPVGTAVVLLVVVTEVVQPLYGHAP